MVCLLKTFETFYLRIVPYYIIIILLLLYYIEKKTFGDLFVWIFFMVQERCRKIAYSSGIYGSFLWIQNSIEFPLFILWSYWTDALSCFLYFHCIDLPCRCVLCISYHKRFSFYKLSDGLFAYNYIVITIHLFWGTDHLERVNLEIMHCYHMPRWKQKHYAFCSSKYILTIYLSRKMQNDCLFKWIYQSLMWIIEVLWMIRFLSSSCNGIERMLSAVILLYWVNMSLCP